MNKLRGRFRRWIQKLRSHPEELGRLERAIVHGVDLGLHGASELRRIRASQMAAALTYYTLFSLIPTIALALVMLQVFVGPDERQQFKDGVIEWILNPIPENGEGGDAPTDETVANGGGEEITRAQRALEIRLEEGLQSLEKIDFRSVGWIGLLLFFYAATTLLQTIERSFNTVYRAHRTRPLFYRLPLYYSVVTLGPLVLLAGVYLRAWFLALVTDGAWTGWLAGPLIFVSPVFTVWLVLLAIYLWLPNSRVKFRAAAIGALVAACLSSVAVELLRLYVQNAAGATILGALALVPLFLFWLYLLWLIVLFGLQVSFILQTFKTANLADEMEKQKTDRFVDSRWILPIAQRIAADFQQGQLTRPKQLADALALPVMALTRLLATMEQAELLRPVEQDKDLGYTLTRPADKIALTELLVLAQKLAPTAPDDSCDTALWQALDDIQEAGQKTVENRTLADLM